MNHPQIVCLGEALIDFKSHHDRSSFPLEYSGHPGGSPFNVAIATARLGATCGFYGQISSDLFGEALMSYLAQNGVCTSGVTRHTAPTTLGFVAEGSSGVRWTFNNAQTADTLYDPQPRPTLPASTRFVVFGSISLLSEPCASSITEVVKAHRDRATVVFDPNCRPSLIADPVAYRARFSAWLRLSHILKLSADDLEWLEPNRDPATVCAKYLQSGPSVVVLTRGGEGATLYARNHPLGITVRAPVTAVIDTVGAGDTFTAGLLVALLERETVDLHTLSASAWHEMLCFAARAAALNCEQAGANPPTRAAVMAARD